MCKTGNSSVSEITVPAAADHLYTVLGFVDEWLKVHGFPEEAAAQVSIAVEEVFVNIARYAYGPRVGDALVKCAVGGDPLFAVIEFSDRGKPFNPLTRDDPVLSLPLENRPVGGLGIYLVKKIMDSVQYNYQDDRNILTLRKQL